MSNGNKPKKPDIKKPAKPDKPKEPKKPTVAQPAKNSAAAMPDAVGRAFDDFENGFFAATTTRAKDTTIALTSNYGYFRVYQYHKKNPNDKEVAIFFFNKHSQKTHELHGTIARKYLSILLRKSGIEDFPIADELAAQADKQDRISALSKYALVWNHSTNAVQRRDYNSHQPGKGDVFVGCTQEYDPGMKEVNFKNWKGEDVKHYQSSRGLRNIGMPTQVLLHETAGQKDMSITHAEKDGNTYLIPHFCINHINAQKKGNIIEFVDTVERTSHGTPMNDRSVGIELVNAPIEAYNGKKKLFNLDASKTGVYLKTVLKNMPKIFLPLEFYPSDDKTGFVLTVPKVDLINSAALSGLKVGASQENAIETVNGVVTIKNCRSDQFEHLVALMQLLQRTGQVADLDLNNKEQHRNVYAKNGKEYFLYQKAWVTKDKVNFHFGVDVRLPGVFCHGLTGKDRLDGFAQGLYLYLRLIYGRSAQGAMQKIIDLLVESKVAKGKRPDLELAEKVTLVDCTDPLVRCREKQPESPQTIKIQNYLEIT